MKQKVKFALDVISNYNVDYADVRLRQTNIEMIRTYNDVLKNVRNDDELGIGIRVLINGRWGFAATPHLDEDNISKTVKRAVNIAKAAAKIEQKPIILTKEKAVIDTFKTPIKKNPFDVSLSDKANILFNVYENAKKVKKVKKVDGYMYFHRIHQQFGNTEGSQLENDIYMSGSSYEITAVG
ncbi:MAG TPA: DNA gyrase modulator, partial [Candidatus Mcinerneyibacterium sp.]|nr:DNA gyrase modulator [Candidatus Mcinerneyibacterium sp.]